MENAIPIFLHSFNHGQYLVYALSDGTFGIYDQKGRIWKHKMKQKIVAIQAYCLNERKNKWVVFAATMNGLIEVRNRNSPSNGLSDDLVLTDAIIKWRS